MRALRPLLFFSLLLGIFSYSQTLLANDPCYYDNQPPVAVCDYHTVVSLGSNGTAKVYATTFDDGSYDNCEIDYFLAARMFPGWCPYGVADDTQFRPYVEFCCEDIGGPLWIIMRVVDKKGNYSECMTEVTVQDNFDPWITCPPDITISCEYWFNLNDLYDPYSRTFGTVVTDPYDRQPVIINDPANSWYYQPHNWGLDGYVSGGGGACGGGGYPQITLDVIDNTHCGVGWITRIWKVHYGGGYGGGYGSGYVECHQKIHIKDFTPFNGYAIHWPKDYEADGCEMINADPGALPPGFDKPTYYDDDCSLIGAAYDDLVFHFIEGVCTKIIRTWTVIDWCQYDPNSYHPHGIWEHVQIIKLFNGEAPQFGNCRDTIVPGFENSCAGRVVLDPHVYDDCTPKELMEYEYKIDIGKNGYYDIKRKGRQVVDEVLPLGWHRVLWIVDDGCGNANTCSFDVHVIDGKKPTPVCYHGLSTVVMPIGGMVTIWAKDFNASSYDNCTYAKNLKYSFSSDLYEKSRIFTCDDIGMNTVQVWVTDGSGNQDYCTTFIQVDDNAGICQTMHPLVGNVTSFSGAPIPDVEFGLYKSMENGDLVMDMTDMSDGSGNFSLGFGTTEFDRVISGQKDGDLLDAISTMDLIKLQEHMFGEEVFSEQAQFIAADLDKSGHVGIQDMTALRNVLLGAGDEKLDKYYALPWIIYPAECPITEALDFDCDLNVFVDHENPPTATIQFHALKLGDVNGDAEGLSTRSGGQYPVFGIAEESGNGSSISWFAGRDLNLKGMQLSMGTVSGRYGEGLTIEKGVIPINQQNYRHLENESLLNIVYTTSEEQIIHEGDLLFTYHFPYAPLEFARNLLDLQNGALPSEIYTTDESTESILFYWKDIQSNSLEVLYDLEVAPNPFTESVSFSFIVENPASADLIFYDAQGRKIFAESYDLTRGEALLHIPGKRFQGVGVYFYHLHFANEVYKGKILRLE